MATCARFVLGQISHETNTFSPISTGLKQFGERGLHYGDEILRAYERTKTSIGGFMDAAREAKQDGVDVELVPVISASAVPSGIVTREAYEHLVGHLIRGIVLAKQTGKVDGVLLSLHGAMVADGIPDAEGDILAKVRKAAGADIPVVATLDLHANMSEQMVENATALFGYDTNPHVDPYERAVEATRCMVGIFLGKWRPVMALAKRPMMPPTINMRTAEGPMVRLFDMARENEARAGVLNVSVFGGFPFADVPRVGTSVLTVTDNNPCLAREIAEHIADEAWNVREQFLKPVVPVRDAVAYAMRRSADAEAKPGPVILADVADNCGGGGSGDTTMLLKTLLDMGATNVGFAMIWDPEAAAMAHMAGEGARVELLLGGKTEPLHGEPLRVKAVVKKLTDGTFVNTGPMGTGLRVSAGPTALLHISGVEVIVISKRMAPNDPEIFRHVGIDPASKPILVVKSRGHFRAGYEPFAKEIVEVDCPGMASPNLSWFTYHNVPRPLFPLDKI